MALEKEVQKEDPNTQLVGEEKEDLRIAVGIAEDLIDQGGIDAIDNAIKHAKDPGQVVGQFLMQLAQEIARNLPEGVTLSPRIWLAGGGALEQVSDYLQDEYDIEREIMDRAEMFVASAIQQKAQSEQQQAPAPAAPPMPGGM